MNDFLSRHLIDNEAFFKEVRHHLHQHPELSGEEYETSEYIRSLLDEWKIPYKCAGKNSVVAVIKGNKEGKVVALRGDMDALPIQEENEIEWKSKKDGVMHACGHDVHTTFMIGCAKILNELKSELNGTVKIIFQEAEENGTGAREIVNTNLLDDVDTIAALHISQEIDSGKFAVGYGVMSAYGAGGKITIETKPSVNALVIAGECVSIITALAEELFPKSEQIVMVPTVVNTEQIENGKPVKVSMAYNTRTLNFENEEKMQHVLALAAEKISTIFDCKSYVELRTPGNVVNNDKYCTDLAIKVIKQTFGDEAVVYSRPVMSGEDFALFQKKIPGTYLHIGGAKDGIYRPLHTNKTFVGDEILPVGIEFLLRYIFEYFTECSTTS